MHNPPGLLMVLFQETFNVDLSYNQTVCLCFTRYYRNNVHVKSNGTTNTMSTLHAYKCLKQHILAGTSFLQAQKLDENVRSACYKNCHPSSTTVADCNKETCMLWWCITLIILLRL